MRKKTKSIVAGRKVTVKKKTTRDIEWKLGVAPFSTFLCEELCSTSTCLYIPDCCRDLFRVLMVSLFLSVLKEMIYLSKFGSIREWIRN